MLTQKAATNISNLKKMSIRQQKAQKNMKNKIQAKTERQNHRQNSDE